MYIIRDYRKLNKKLKSPVVATIGIFDGMHLGHRDIINRCVKRAKRLRGMSMVITFYPHPLKIVRPNVEPALIMPLDHRINIIKNLGVDACVIINFNRKFSKISAEGFIEDILIKIFKIKELLVGTNFKFGSMAKGHVALLKRFSKRFNYSLSIAKGVKFKKSMISSTLLRRKIATGDILLTNKLLGRNYSISGVVVKGSKRGRRLGFPTANIKTSQRALPPDGVYPALIGIKRKIFRGVLNVGRRPTFHRKSSNPLIEAHIFNFNRTLYGQEIEVIPLRRIRRERKFKDASSLITQIKKDIVISKAILASYEF